MSPKVPAERQSTARVTLGGGRSVDYAPGVLRTWTWDYRHLSMDDYGAIVAWFAGHNGPGPFVLIDEAERNQLTVNQSSATSETNGTTGFTADGTLVSAGWGNPRGPRCLAWETPVGGGTLALGPPTSALIGIPVIPCLTYRWQAIVTGDAALSVTPQLVWLTWSGAVLSTSAGAVVGADPGGVPVVASAVAPAGAVWVRPELTTPGIPGIARMAGGMVPIAAGPGCWTPGSLLVDYLQLSIPTARDPGTVWAPGLGVPMVSLPSIDHTLFLVDRHDTTLTLVEVR